MAKNLKKGSKVYISISGRGLKRTPGVVMSVRAKDDDVTVRVVDGYAKGKVFARRLKEVKRRSK